MNIFSGNTGMSYEDVQRKKRIADQLVQANQYTPRNVGEGLSAIGRALAARGMEKRAETADKANREAFDKQYGAIFGGGMTSDVAAPSMPSNQAMPDSGGGAGAAEIRAGLVQRGIPEHVADAFIMNAKDESGLNPGINEIEPLVPGSRGGFGLLQWTGPRRRALEAFAAKRGAPVSDVDVQLDFLMTELQGPESRAAQAIFSAPDKGSAAAAIVNKFLRPAEQHRARREAKYTRGQGSGPASQMTIEALAEAAGSPYASPGQKAVLSALLQQKMQANDPFAQLDLQYKRAQLDALQNPQVKPTAAIQEYQLAQSQGFDGTFTDYQRALEEAGATNVTTTVGGGVKPLGTEGQILVEDPTAPGGYRVEIAPGSKLDMERQDDKASGERKKSNMDTATETITTAARYAREAAQNRQVGGVIGSLAARNPASQNAEVYRQVDVLKSTAKISNLQAMRDASKTGGALGAVTAPELKMLEDASGALDPRSPNFERDLDNYERTLLRVVHGREAGDKIFEASRPGAASDAAPAVPDGSGLSQGEWDALWPTLTDEEKAAFQ